MGHSLTKLQKEALCYMLQHDWISYREKDDRTMNSLHDRGLVSWVHGNQKRHWQLTHIGLKEARRLRDE